MELLGSNVYKGLIEYDCILRRERYGDNKVTIPNKKSVKRSLLDKVFSWTYIIYYQEKVHILKYRISCVYLRTSTYSLV